MIIYLATPYTQITPEVSTEQYVKTMCEIDGLLSEAGLVTVSPIYKHLLFINGVNLPGNWEYWKNYCEVLLNACSLMLVIKHDNYDKSIGVMEEIYLASEKNIPILFVDPKWSKEELQHFIMRLKHG